MALNNTRKLLILRCGESTGEPFSTIPNPFFRNLLASLGVEPINTDSMPCSKAGMELNVPRLRDATQIMNESDEKGSLPSVHELCGPCREMSGLILG
jgi:hypothetical protein